MRQWLDFFSLHARLLIIVLLLLIIALIKPAIPLKKNIYTYVFVIDITQSMNARDYHQEGMPSDRLSFVKHALHHTLQHLPCQSKVALGLFTNKNMFLLFNPLEVCKHYAVIEASLMKIDWRMAWATNSHIARGIYTSLRDVGRLDASPRLVFFSDGQQTPSAAKEPAFLLKPGELNGFIVGTGNLKPVPVPMLDEHDQVTGYWQTADANSQSFKRSEAKAQTYLSAVQENHLQRLAGITGLDYLHLNSPEQLSQALQTGEPEVMTSVDTEISWLFALAALILFVLPYFLHPRYGDR